jgi:hypothetical protein
VRGEREAGEHSPSADCFASNLSFERLTQALVLDGFADVLRNLILFSRRVQ